MTSEVETATESELATAMAEMKAMILEYKKRTTKLRDDASKNEEIGPYMKEAQSMPNNDENFWRGGGGLEEEEGKREKS